MAPRTSSETLAITGSAKPERRLEPIGNRDGQAERSYLERQQEHAVEQQHQPGRVAEELVVNHAPARTGRTSDICA